MHVFFYKKHFYKQRQTENQTNAKQHPEAELWLSDSCSKIDAAKIDLGLDMDTYIVHKKAS